MPISYTYGEGMTRKIIAWAILFFFFTTSNYSWAQTSTVTSSSTTVTNPNNISEEDFLKSINVTVQLHTVTILPQGVTQKKCHPFLGTYSNPLAGVIDEPEINTRAPNTEVIAVNRSIYESELINTLYVQNGTDGAKACSAKKEDIAQCSLNVNADPEKIKALLKEISLYVSANIVCDDIETPETPVTSKAISDFNWIMAYQQYLIDYVYWLGEYNKETVPEIKILLSYHVGKIFQALASAIKGVTVLKYADGTKIEVVYTRRSYDTAKTLSLEDLTPYKTNYTDVAAMYIQHNNYFTMMYKAAYVEAQKLNIENYIYQDYVYLHHETDVRAKTGELCAATDGDCFEKVLKHGTVYLEGLKADKDAVQKTDAQIKQEFDDFRTAVNKARDIFNAQLKNTRQDGSEKLETESDSDGPYLQPADFATLKEYSKALVAYFATAKGQEQINSYQKQISDLASAYPAARFIIQGFNLYDVVGIPGMRQQYYVDPVKEAEKVADIKNEQAHHSTAYGETFDSPAIDNIGPYRNSNADLLYPAPDVCSMMTGSASTCQGQIKGWIDDAQKQIIDYGKGLADKYSDFADETSTAKLEGYAAEQIASLLMTQPMSMARTLGGSGYAESTILANSTKIIKIEIAKIKADKERQQEINKIFAYVGMIAGAIMIATGVGSWAGAAIFGAIGPTLLTTIYAVNMVAMVAMAVSAYQQLGGLSDIKKGIGAMAATGHIDADTLAKLSTQQQSLTLTSYITIAAMPLDLLMIPQVVGFVGALAKGGRYLEAFVAFGKTEAVVMKELEAIHGEKKVTNFWFYMKMSGKTTEEIAAMAKDEELMNGISDLLDGPIHRRVYRKINKKINTLTEAKTAKTTAAVADKKTTATTKSTSNDIKNTTKNNTEDLTKKTTNETDKAPVTGSGVTSALKTDYEGVFSKFGIADSPQSRKTLDYMMNKAYTRPLTQEDLLGMSKTDFIGEFGRSERNSKSMFKTTPTEFDLVKIKAKWSDKLPKIEEALKAPISATGEGSWMRSIGQTDIIKWLDKFGTLKKSTIFSTVKIEGQEIQIGDAVLEKARQYAYDMTKGKFDFEIKGSFIYKDTGNTKEIVDFMPVESVSVSFPSNEMLVGTSVQSSKASAGTGATQYTYLRGDLDKAFEESIFGAVDKSGKYKGPGEFPKNIDVHSHPYYSPFQKVGSGADYRNDMRAIITPGKDKDDFNLLFVKNDAKDTKLTEIIPMTAAKKKPDVMILTMMPGTNGNSITTTIANLSKADKDILTVGTKSLGTTELNPLAFDMNTRFSDPTEMKDLVSDMKSGKYANNGYDYIATRNGINDSPMGTGPKEVECPANGYMTPDALPKASLKGNFEKLNLSSAETDPKKVLPTSMYKEPKDPQYRFAGYFTDLIGVKSYTYEETLSSLALDAKTIQSYKGKTVLSLGEGYGELLPNLKKQGVNIYGVDTWYNARLFDKDLVEQSKSYDDFTSYITKNKGSLIAGNAKDLPIANNTVDIILSNKLLNNVYRSEGAIIDEALRVLKPGGEARFSGVLPKTDRDSYKLFEKLDKLQTEGKIKYEYISNDLHTGKTSQSGFTEQTKMGVVIISKTK